MPYFKIGEKAIQINLKRDYICNGEICTIIEGLKIRKIKGNRMKLCYIAEDSEGLFTIAPKFLRKLPDDNDKISWEDMKDIFSDEFMKVKV